MLAMNAETPLPPPSADLERIFQAHHSQVFGTAYRVTGSAQDAEDVLQTVFLRLLRRQRRGRPLARARGATCTGRRSTPPST